MVRIVVIVAAAIVALGVVGIVALLLFIDPNHYRGDVERIARERTGRQLTIQGKLELKIFPRLALSVHGVQLGNPPGFGAQPGMGQPFLTVQNASIGVKLLPLLGKRLEISRVAVDGVTAYLISRGDVNNWKDLTGSKGAAAQQSSPDVTSTQGSVSIEGVDVTNSRLVLTDELKRSTTEVANLELHTGRLSLGADASLAPTKIEFKIGDSVVVMSVSGEKLSSDRVVSGDLAIPKTSARQLLRSLGIALPVTRDSHAFAAFALQTNFRLTKKQLHLSDLQLTLDDTSVQGAAGIEDLESMALAFDLKVNGINVDRYRAPVEKMSPAPSGKRPPSPVPPEKPPTPLPLETLRKVDVHGTLHVGSATFAALVFTDVTMPLMARNGHIHLGPTQAGLYGGAYNGDIVLDVRPVEAQLSLNEHVHGTDIGALVKAAFDSARLVGRADVNVAVTGLGNTDRAMMRSLTGKIDATVKQGALLGVDITYELQRATALLNHQSAPQRTGPERTVFNSLQTSATLDKGVLRTDDLRIETDFLKVHGGGTLDLDTEAIDYKLVAGFYKLPPSQGDRGGSGLVSLKSIEVPLDITGTIANPTVRPDIQALAKGQLGQELKQKAGDLVKKTLGDKLKDLFGH